MCAVILNPLKRVELRLEGSWVGISTISAGTLSSLQNLHVVEPVCWVYFVFVIDIH